jgi:hypothetical protein
MKDNYAKLKDEQEKRTDHLHEEIHELESVLKERDDTILFMMNALKIHDIISFEGFNKHSDKILKNLSSKRDKDEPINHVYQTSKGEFLIDENYDNELVEAKTTKIILVFDNGHENVLYPDKHVVISRENVNFLLNHYRSHRDDEEHHNNDLMKFYKIREEVERK